MKKEKEIHGWPISTKLDNFLVLVKNLKAEGQESRANAVAHLIERCRIAESKKVKKEN